MPLQRGGGQARCLLESTSHPVDRIASQVGFGSTTAFRDRFKRLVGTSPTACRVAFQGAHHRRERGPVRPPTTG